jgi:hypothetical protein
MSDSKTIPKYTQPLAEIIRRRRSVRTYVPHDLAPGVKENIESYLVSVRAPFPGRFYFKLLDKPGLARTAGTKLGTYGMIAGARYFIAAAAPKTDPPLIALGYALEDVVLFLTSLGLGTCWLAATFSRSAFSRAVGLRDDEILPIVTPVGAPSTVIRTPIDILIKPFPNRKHRLASDRLFFKDDFTQPLSTEAAGPFAPALEAVRLAPSASNKQPWRVLADSRGFHFYLRHDPGYARLFPYDIQKIDLGIALCHFGLTAAETGLPGGWRQSGAGMPEAPAGHEYIASWEY